MLLPKAVITVLNWDLPIAVVMPLCIKKAEAVISRPSKDTQGYTVS